MQSNIISSPELASQGHQKIEWVRGNMPILNQLEDQFAQERPFAGKQLTVCIHLEAKTAYLALVLRAGGAMVSVTGSNPESTKDDADEFIFGELKLNLDAHQVFIHDNEIAFTALEFRLLKHLIDRRGRVQSRDQLLEEVWGYSAEVTTRTVDTHIKRLREKLGSTGEYVQTIRGVGYRFSKTPH